MKKFYTLLSAVVLTAVTANAQTNIVENGDFEAWDSATFPTGFSPDPYTAGVSQETTTVYAGTYSAKHQTPATGSVKIQNEVDGIVPGHSYTISYWFKDNDTNARSRIWSYWLTAEYTTITESNDNDGLLRTSTYSEDNSEWVQYSITVTAPATAAQLRFEVRSYSTADGSGVIYYDNMSVIDNDATAGVKDNAIAGLAMFPNPATGSILNITSNSNAAKTVAIFDVLGKQVINTTSNGTVNIAGLNSGVYIVKITEEGKTATRKLVVK
jgi:hypothetical protein